MGFAPLVKQYGQVFVTAKGQFVIAEDGTFLPYPPIHPHHFHLYPTTEASFPNRNLLASMYGDSACADRGYAGSIECLLQTFPPGHGMPVDAPLAMDLALNDVRTKGSPPLAVYLEVALKWTVIPQRPVSTLGSLQPSVFSLNNAEAKNNVFYTPANGSSVQFYTGTFASAGTLVHAAFHTRHAWTDAVWLVQGGLHDVGLDQAPYSINLKKPWVPFYPEAHNRLLDDVKIHVLSHLGEPGRNTTAHIRCIATPKPALDKPDVVKDIPRWYLYNPGFTNYKIESVKNAVSRNVHFQLDYNLVKLSDLHFSQGMTHEQGYVRRSNGEQVECFGEWDFKEGDPFTVIGFFRPQCQRGCADVVERHPDGVPQQLGFHGIYLNKAKLAGSVLYPWFVFAAQDPAMNIVAGKNETQVLRSPMTATDALLSLGQGGYPPSHTTTTRKFGKAIETLHSLMSNASVNRLDNELYKGIPQFVHKLLSPYKGAMHYNDLALDEIRCTILLDNSCM
eukprot:gene6654-7968_t